MWSVTPGAQVPAGGGSALSRVRATTLNDGMKNPKNPDIAEAEESANSQPSAGQWCALTSVPGPGGTRGRLGD